jgi:WXG100 family type VII secretion target
MTDEIKLVYATAEDMIRIFEQGVEQLENTMQEMQSIANTLEDGALLGRGGEAFTDAIRSKLCPAISRLNDKFQELAGDVQKAIDYMQQADRTSASKF